MKHRGHVHPHHANHARDRHEPWPPFRSRVESLQGLRIHGSTTECCSYAVINAAKSIRLPSNLLCRRTLPRRFRPWRKKPLVSGKARERQASNQHQPSRFRQTRASSRTSFACPVRPGLNSACITTAACSKKSKCFWKKWRCVIRLENTRDRSEHAHPDEHEGRVG